MDNLKNNLNIKGSVKATGTRLEGVGKDEHVKGWMEEHGPDHVEYIKSTDNKSNFFRIKGALTKAQLSELTGLGCKITADTITFKDANRLAVEKVLNVKNGTLNIDGSVRASGARLVGAEKDEHVKGWMEEHGPSYVEYLTGSDVNGNNFRITGALTKAQLSELTGLGCKITADSISFKGANKSAVEKVLNFKK